MLRTRSLLLRYYCQGLLSPPQICNRNLSQVPLSSFLFPCLFFSHFLFLSFLLSFTIFPRFSSLSSFFSHLPQFSFFFLLSFLFPSQGSHCFSPARGLEGSAVSSPSGSGRSSAAKWFVVHFELKTALLVIAILIIPVYTFNKTPHIFDWALAAPTRYGNRSPCLMS